MTAMEGVPPQVLNQDERRGHGPERAGDRSDFLRKALECLLFSAPGPLSTDELAEMLEVAPSDVVILLRCLQQAYEGRSGLMIVEVAGGWRMVTSPQFGPYVRRLHPAPKVRLSKSSLEVLAIIAYHQPISRPEIESLRGLDSEGAIQSLLEHGLIQVVGHRPGAGRARLFATTRKFLELFGLRSLEDLPTLSDWLERAQQILDRSPVDDHREKFLPGEGGNRPSDGQGNL